MAGHGLPTLVPPSPRRSPELSQRAIPRWAEDPTALLVQRIFLTICAVLSLVSAAYLTGASLRRSSRRRLVGQQVLALAFSDLLLCIWGWVVPAVASGIWLWPGDPPWCGSFTFIFRWLQVQSVLSSAAIPLGVLAALLRRKVVVLWLHWGPLLAVPVTTILNLAYLVQPAFGASDLPLPYCESPELAELVTVFCFIGIVYGLAVKRMQSTAPGSVVARSIQGARRYMMAFFCSFAIYVLSLLRESLVGKDIHSNVFWLEVSLRQGCYTLNAFMNFLAFSVQRREALNLRRTVAHVGFNSNVSNHELSMPTAANTMTDDLRDSADPEEDEDDLDCWLNLGFIDFADEAEPGSAAATGTAPSLDPTLPTYGASALSMSVLGPPSADLTPRPSFRRAQGDGRSVPSA